MLEYTTKSKYRRLHPGWNTWSEILCTWVAIQLIPSREAPPELFLGTGTERCNVLNDFPGPRDISHSMPVCSLSFVLNLGYTRACYTQVLFSTRFLAFNCHQNERFIWNWHLAKSYLHSPCKKRQGTQDTVLRHWQEGLIFRCDQTIRGKNVNVEECFSFKMVDNSL